jgi:uncharacterized membrane protein
MNLFLAIFWLIFAVLFATEVAESTKWHAAGYTFLLALLFFFRHQEDKN